MVLNKKKQCIPRRVVGIIKTKLKVGLNSVFVDLQPVAVRATQHRIQASEDCTNDRKTLRLMLMKRLSARLSLRFFE